jgi:hypothetical protein
MQMLRRVWEDVRRGDNIDLYLTAGVAIVLTLLNVLGFAPQSLVASMTLAVLGLLAISSLVNRRKIDTMLAREGMFAENFPANWIERLEDSSELWIFGTNLGRTITSYFSLFERKLKRGDTIKVLLVDPNGMAMKLAAERRVQSTYVDENLALIRNSIKGFCELRDMAPDRIEIRTIDYPFSFGIFATDPETAKSTLYLSYYPFKTPTPSIPKIVLRPKDGHWHDHFKMEMHNLWKFATPWNCESSD